MAYNSSSENDCDDDNLTPLLSMLCLVTDHYMAPPCPLEVAEYGAILAQQQEQAAPSSSSFSQGDSPFQPPTEGFSFISPIPILVPIFRVFGPVTRLLPPPAPVSPRSPTMPSSSSSSSALPSPSQNGCLHIHGAFPYLYIRPHNNVLPPQPTLSQPHPDWSDPLSVQACSNFITDQFEDLLQEIASHGSLRVGGSGSGSSASSCRGSSFKRHHRFIRKMYVVKGTPFYGYAPPGIAGSPASSPSGHTHFLKVEYYDPSTKWLLRKLLEGEHTLLPSRGPSSSSSDPSHASYDDLLLLGGRWNVFEGHIPYAVQVMKDQGFSGMSELLVREVRFRPKLREDGPGFTKSNTDEMLMWREDGFGGVDGQPADAAEKDDDHMVEGPESSQGIEDSQSSIRSPPSQQSCAREFSLSLNLNQVNESLSQEEEEQVQEVLAGDDECSAQQQGNPQNEDPMDLGRLPSPIQQRGVVTLMDGKRDPPFWVKKMTNAKVEADTHVSEILNRAIIRRDDEERLKLEQTQGATPRKIYWNAVPSLKEIWECEQERATSILGPKGFDAIGGNAFLLPPKVKTGAAAKAGDNSDGDDDDDKEDYNVASAPKCSLKETSAGRAVTCIKKLFNKSLGSDEQRAYRKALSEIVKRHARKIEEDDKVASVESGRRTFEGQEKKFSVDADDEDRSDDGGLDDLVDRLQEGSSQDDAESSQGSARSMSAKQIQSSLLAHASQMSVPQNQGGPFRRSLTQGGPFTQGAMTQGGMLTQGTTRRHIHLFEAEANASSEISWSRFQAAPDRSVGSDQSRGAILKDEERRRDFHRNMLTQVQQDETNFMGDEEACEDEYYPGKILRVCPNKTSYDIDFDDCQTEYGVDYRRIRRLHQAGVHIESLKVGDKVEARRSQTIDVLAADVERGAKEATEQANALEKDARMKAAELLYESDGDHCFADSEEEEEGEGGEKEVEGERNNFQPLAFQRSNSAALGFNTRVSSQASSFSYEGNEFLYQNSQASSALGSAPLQSPSNFSTRFAPIDHASSSNYSLSNLDEEESENIPIVLKGHLTLDCRPPTKSETKCGSDTLFRIGDPNALSYFGRLEKATKALECWPFSVKNKSPPSYLLSRSRDVSGTDAAGGKGFGPSGPVITLAGKAMLTHDKMCFWAERTLANVCSVSGRRSSDDGAAATPKVQQQVEERTEKVCGLDDSEMKGDDFQSQYSSADADESRSMSPPPPPPPNTSRKVPGAALSRSRAPAAFEADRISGEEVVGTGITQRARRDSMSYNSQSSEGPNPLAGMGNQGGVMHIGPDGPGGGLKITRSSLSNDPSRPVTLMAVEVYVLQRDSSGDLSTGKERKRIIAYTPDPAKDPVQAISYVFARDPGRGGAVEIVLEGTVSIPTSAQVGDSKQTETSRILVLNNGLPGRKRKMETKSNERDLLLRLAGIIQHYDPDALLSWDTHAAGVGYLIKRGVELGKVVRHGEFEIGAENNLGPVDMVRLMGRTPTQKDGRLKIFGAGDGIGEREGSDGGGGVGSVKVVFEGSGLGADWDERVGAGAAASSIVGRLVICCWKIMSEEVKHPNISFLPAAVAAVLRKKLPHHDGLTLKKWYGENGGKERYRVLDYKVLCCKACIFLLDALDVIGRAGEGARLSGVELSQSLPGIRGSQYRVEGVLIRALVALKSNERGNLGRDSVDSRGGTMSSSVEPTGSTADSPWKQSDQRTTNEFSWSPSKSIKSIVFQFPDKGFLFASPTKKETEALEALETFPLVIEPKSAFHTDPVVVCDFTALYPSLVIAYNLCYSTLAGKVRYGTTSTLDREGETSGRIGMFKYPEKTTARVLKEHMSFDENNNFLPKCGANGKMKRELAYIAPSGGVFVSEAVLKGVLPQVLDEILSTRAMVKRAMKAYKEKGDKSLPASLWRQLEAKQLALKLVANVTYGYTSATFSGRCSCPLVADAIVEISRRTLSRAMNVASTWGMEVGGRWNGVEVIYGDTDSIFVKCPGRSIGEAFEFGKAFCNSVTKMNPNPVALKLEKVYSSCILQTKKRYCGWMYSSPNQRVGEFEAKGIETVRFDQCGLTQKVLKGALVTLFKTGNVEILKRYLQRHWYKLLAGKLPVSDFVITGRVRSEYRNGATGPVQAVLAARLSAEDPMLGVRHKERLPYVIVATPGNSYKISDLVVSPLELLENWDSLAPHIMYYATHLLNPALNRSFNLEPLKLNIDALFRECPKPSSRRRFWPLPTLGNQLSTSITRYFGSDTCAICGAKCKARSSAPSIACDGCKSAESFSGSVAVAFHRVNAAQKKSAAAAKKCAECNGCSERSDTFATVKEPKAGVALPFANCINIDCGVLYERHRAKEAEIEGEELCKDLGLLTCYLDDKSLKKKGYDAWGDEEEEGAIGAQLGGGGVWKGGGEGSNGKFKERR